MGRRALVTARPLPYNPRMLLHAARVALLLAAEALEPKVSIDAEVRWRDRAWPWRCDLNLHVNNAEYARLFEYGRWVWTLRTGIFERFRTERLRTVVVGSTLLFRREVRLMRGFEVRTRLCGVDPRSVVFEQALWLGGELACHSYHRLMMRGPSGLIDPRPLVAGAVPTVDDAAVLSWLDSQSTVLDREKRGVLHASA